jgi:hypothetical protein
MTNETPSIGTPDAPPGGADRPADQQRRRFVRGAASVAPVVLTLRSGAVAAASCTGAKLITTLDQNGKINGDVSGLTSTDRCFTNPDVCTGVSGSKISAGNSNGTVDPSGSNAFCRGGTYSDNQPVAILSSLSATSLLGRTAG